MNNMMKQVQQMQEDMVAAQAALAETTRRGQCRRRHGEGDRHRHRRPASITLSPDVVDPDDIEMLQDLVVAAVADANRAAQALQSETHGWRDRRARPQRVRPRLSATISRR